MSSPIVGASARQSVSMVDVVAVPSSTAGWRSSQPRKPRLVVTP
jgi:hypothetical protein